MQDAIDDLRAALDQMNRSLSKIAELTEENNAQLKQINERLSKVTG